MELKTLRDKYRSEPAEADEAPVSSASAGRRDDGDLWPSDHYSPQPPGFYYGHDGTLQPCSSEQEVYRVPNGNRSSRPLARSWRTTDVLAALPYRTLYRHWIRLPGRAVSAALYLDKGSLPTDAQLEEVSCALGDVQS